MQDSCYGCIKKEIIDCEDCKLMKEQLEFVLNTMLRKSSKYSFIIGGNKHGKKYFCYFGKEPYELLDENLYHYTDSLPDVLSYLIGRFHLEFPNEPKPKLKKFLSEYEKHIIINKE